MKFEIENYNKFNDKYLLAVKTLEVNEILDELNSNLNNVFYNNINNLMYRLYEDKFFTSSNRMINLYIDIREQNFKYRYEKARIKKEHIIMSLKVQYKQKTLIVHFCNFDDNKSIDFNNANDSFLKLYKSSKSKPYSYNWKVYKGLYDIVSYLSAYLRDRGKFSSNYNKSIIYLNMYDISKSDIRKNKVNAKESIAKDKILIVNNDNGRKYNISCVRY